MNGKVKWFSESKGYGYIVSEEGKEYYFTVKHIQGAELPHNGDAVTFEARTSKRGPVAGTVVITEKASEKRAAEKQAKRDENDPRVNCYTCNKKMTPRIIMRKGSISHSICPYCGSVYKNFSNCFIATAVYGDSFAEEVIALRRFRDETLLTNTLGKVLVKAYYKVSPPIAEKLKNMPKTSACVRKCLNKLAAYYGGKI
ncbi:cold shock domain-containing protein [Neisseria sp. HMSC068C04]|jgi:cold shock protein|uniref:cold shock domain-containing protein n=2 Tax=Neisseria TaxID=482 RepID=UPI0008A37896|nr:cold shock domain-containing protein [Neisseria sp. HMSC068C04]OFM31086.1 cold-shock protein [Neisseria sp. HMSC068C04]